MTTHTRATLDAIARDDLYEAGTEAPRAAARCDGGYGDDDALWVAQAAEMPAPLDWASDSELDELEEAVAEAMSALPAPKAGAEEIAAPPAPKS